MSGVPPHRRSPPFHWQGSRAGRHGRGRSGPVQEGPKTLIVRESDRSRMHALAMTHGGSRARAPRRPTCARRRPRRRPPRSVRLPPPPCSSTLAPSTVRARLPCRTVDLNVGPRALGSRGMDRRDRSDPLGTDARLRTESRTVLQRIVESAAEVTDARYGASGRAQPRRPHRGVRDDRCDRRAARGDR